MSDTQLEQLRQQIFQQVAMAADEARIGTREDWQAVEEVEHWIEVLHGAIDDGMDAACQRAAEADNR